MKNNGKGAILVVGFIFIVAAFVKKIGFIPTSNNLWTNNNNGSNSDSFVDQDWTISEFNLSGEHFKLMDVIYTNSMGNMDFPSLSLNNQSIVMDGDTLISDHYFVKVTYQITNNSDREASHGMNNFKINFFENGTDLDMPKEFSSNSQNVGMTSDKSYMITQLQVGETKEISIGMILPKEYIEKYQLVLSYNPTGSEVPRNELNEMIMNEYFRLILLDSFLKGEVVDD